MLMRRFLQRANKISDFHLLKEYKFNDIALLDLSLRHKSLGDKNNERLEFLGDAILDLIIAEELYERFPMADEGQLTRLRSSIVKGDTLAKIATEQHLDEKIQFGESERKSAAWRRESILANTLEAVVGAIYLDSDLSKCKVTIMPLFESLLDDADPEKIQKDPKTRLQEYLQSVQKELPVYDVLKESGPAHKRMYEVSCKLQGVKKDFIAKGNSKRFAEQSAAQLALAYLQDKS